MLACDMSTVQPPDYNPYNIDVTPKANMEIASLGTMP